MAEPQTSSEALQRQKGGGDQIARPEQQKQALPPRRVTVPCDVFENDNQYLIVADMPGLEAEQCDLVIRGDRLEMEGSRMLGDQQIVYERSFAMPHNADTKDITASYKDGVVRVTIAKTQESRPRRIPVHA